MQQPRPQIREIDAGPDGQLERAPEPPVDLDEAGRARAVVPELDHRRPMPGHRREQPAGGLLQPRIDGDRATQAAARSRRSHVAETLVREPYDRRAVVVQRKHALPPSRDDALDDRPAVALASGERTLLEDGGVLHVLRAVLGEKPAAIPEVARARLHDTGV